MAEIAEKYASFDSTPTPADIEGLYSRNPEYFLVAEESGKVIGFVTGYERTGLPEEVLRNWNAQRVGYLELVAVDMAHRKAGVGRALLDSILSKFRENGVDLVILDVGVGQKEALRLYEKAGFQVRAYNMVKRLASPSEKLA